MDIFVAVPDAPEAPTADDITATSCKVLWQPPANDGGAPVTGYHLERQSGFSPRWARINKDLIEGTTYDLSDLVEDNTYTFRVTAVNKAGPSKPSKESDTFKAKNPWSKHFRSLTYISKFTLIASTVIHTTQHHNLTFRFNYFF